MPLTAGQSRWLKVHARAKIGMRGQTRSKALHDYTKNMTSITSRGLADVFREYLREYHAIFVDDCSNPEYSGVTDEMREVLMRHSHFSGGSLTHSERSKSGYEPKGWVYERLFNPLGTMSTAMWLTYKHLKDGSTKVYIRGADIEYQEYGTGTLGALRPHPNNPFGADSYNKGASIKTDKVNGKEISYWVYGQYARVGSPSGHFVYDARKKTSEYLQYGNFKGKMIDDIEEHTKEFMSSIFISEFGR